MEYNHNPFTDMAKMGTYSARGGFGETIQTPMDYMAQWKNEATRAPFIEIARKLQQENLAKTEFDNREHIAPWAVQGRMDKAAAQGFTNREVDIRNRHNTVMNPMLQEKQRYENLALPSATDLTIATNQDKLRQVQSAPLRELEAGVASIYDQLMKPTATGQRISPAQVTKEYMNRVDQLASTISDPALREQFIQRYGGDPSKSFVQAANAHARGYHTPEYRKLMDQELEKSATARANAQTSAGATIQAANIRENGDMERFNKGLDQPKTQAAIVANARQVLQNPDAPAEQKAVATQIVMGEVQKQYNEFIKAATASSPGLLTDKTFMDTAFERIKSQNGLGTKPTAGESIPDLRIKALVEKQGGQYEPDKYKYRINANGQVERALK